MRARLLVAVLAFLAVPAQAHAAVDITQRLFDANGQPSLTANTPTATTISWRICAPDCGAIVATGNSFAPGPTAAGTTFQAEATQDGQTTTARTPAWQGQVSSVTPPTVSGDLHIGKPVTATAGTWSGGWGSDDTSGLGLIACRTADGTDCHDISQFATQTIDPVYAGYYLRAWEQRYGFGIAFPAIAQLFPAGQISSFAATTANQVTALGPLVGPIPAGVPGTAPSFTGQLQVGGKVTSATGTWPDRPADGTIASGLRACPTFKDTADCIALTPLRSGGGAVPSATATLDASVQGWYVGAVDLHSWPQAAGIPQPDTAGSTLKVPAASPVVIYGPLSQSPVAPKGTDPPVVTVPDPKALPFKPSVSLRKKASRSGKKLTLGTLRCAARCVARISVRQGNDNQASSITVSKKTKALTIRTADIDKAGGSLHVIVTFDHSPVTKRGTVRLP